MKIIEITVKRKIDCGEELCGYCHFNETFRCSLTGKDLEDKKGGRYYHQRLSECKKAEVPNG